MDTLYIGNIPLDYKYARFSNNYVDLYKQPNIEGTLDYYRIFFYDNYFNYDHLQTTYSQYNSTTAKEINVSQDFRYRRDFPSICFLSLINILVIVFCFNLVTSAFKKGGLFSGLL